MGIYSLALARWAGPTGRVMAFEPNPEAADLLDQHVRRNGMRDRVTVVREAVGSASGEHPFYATGLEGISRLGNPNPESPASPAPARISVRLTTIDAYCDRQGIEPDWIVMDIEGYEFAALEGAVRTIARRAGRLQLVAEFHPTLWPLAGYEAQDGRELLERLGLSTTSLSGQLDPWTQHGAVLLRTAQG
jgi:FkbM family methyltransferase